MHLGPFGCLRNSVRNGPNKCIRWQELKTDLKLTFWCISCYLGAFGAVWLPYETRCKTGRTSAKVRATKLHQNFFATNAPDSPHWTLNSCSGLFSTIWVHFGLFGCLTKLGAKWDITGAKVHATKSRQNFSQQMHPIHPTGY